MQKQARIFDFIINGQGGGVKAVGRENIEKNINYIFGDEVGTIATINGDQLDAEFLSWITAHKNSNRILMVGGGDGTILTAATHMIKEGIVFGIVPLGTQGFVKKLLGLPPDYVQAMKSYKDGEFSVQALDVGRVNDQAFLYGLMLDTGSVQIFEAREHHRNGDMGSVIKSAFSSTFNILAGKKLQMRLDDTTDIRARLASITVNAMTPRANTLEDFKQGGMKQVFGNMFARKEECDGKMVLYTHSGRLDKLLAMGPKLWNGTWDQGMDKICQTQFNLSSDAKEIPIILDGEIVKASFPMKIDITPSALKLYRPG